MKFILENENENVIEPKVFFEVVADFGDKIGTKTVYTHEHYSDCLHAIRELERGNILQDFDLTFDELKEIQKIYICVTLQADEIFIYDNNQTASATMEYYSVVK